MHTRLSMAKKLGLALLLAVLGAGSAAADVVTDWNQVLLDAIRTSRTNPPRATRAMAMMHVAIFDAVNGIDRQYEPYHVTDLGPVGASLEAAAAAAADRVLVALYPDLEATFTARLMQDLAAVPAGPAKDAGIAWGEQTADAIMALRSQDGADQAVSYEAPVGASWWVPTPPAFAPALLPDWPYVTPWALQSGSQLRSPGPPLLTDAGYVEAFREVRSLGRSDSAVRTADQSEIALFWNDGVGTQTPPGHWNDIARLLALERGSSLLDNARLFALLGITVADAAIVSWDNKYHYGHWRPYTGIVMADLDGNPLTAPDPTWSSFITTPPFPSYTSGHSTFSGASGRLLADFFGSDQIAFNAVSDGAPGAVRSYFSLSQAAEEAGQSRIYGGIHWQYENRDGLASGRALADHAFFNYLRPLDKPVTACVPSDTRLCLQTGRFAVEVDWRSRPGGEASATGSGHPMAGTDSSGAFWFFNPENQELLVKVLDACTTRERFWVFAAGATNVEYILRVTDTQTGTVRTYYNPLGHPAEAVIDTQAFATCP